MEHTVGSDVGRYGGALAVFLVGVTDGFAEDFLVGFVDGENFLVGERLLVGVADGIYEGFLDGRRVVGFADGDLDRAIAGATVGLEGLVAGLVEGLVGVVDVAILKIPTNINITL